MSDIGMTLSDARRELVAARHQLRIAEDYYRSCRLRAEIELGEEVAGDTKRLGTNAEDRKRAFDAKVDSDDACQRAQESLREAQRATEEIQAVVDIHLDARRERDLSLRERAVALMESGASDPMQPALLP